MVVENRSIRKGNSRMVIFLILSQYNVKYANVQEESENPENYSAPHSGADPAGNGRNRGTLRASC